MTILEEKLRILIKNCEKAQITLQCIDSFAQHRALSEVKKSSIDFFECLENTVAVLNIKNIKDLTNREDILKLYYIILRSIYIIDNQDRRYLSDERSHDSAMLSQILLVKEDYYNRFSRADNWIRLNSIYTNGLMFGIIKCHKTNIQSILRCLTENLSLDTVRSQSVPQYLEKFEKSIFYYLRTGDLKNRLYLPFY